MDWWMRSSGNILGEDGLVKITALIVGIGIVAYAVIAATVF